jgi:hypothetical protein
MKSIERRFREIDAKQPNHGSIINLAVAVRGQAFSADTIHRWFEKLIPEDDYDKTDKLAILRHLVSISKA